MHKMNFAALDVVTQRTEITYDDNQHKVCLFVLSAVRTL